MTVIEELEKLAIQAGGGPASMTIQVNPKAHTTPFGTEIRQQVTVCIPLSNGNTLNVTASTPREALREAQARLDKLAANAA